jgi:hypothetical protein
VTVIDRQHAHTVRLEAQALEQRAGNALGVGDAAADAVLGALLAIAKRLELLEAALVTERP